MQVGNSIGGLPRVRTVIEIQENAFYPLEDLDEMFRGVVDLKTLRDRMAKTEGLNPKAE